VVTTVQGRYDLSERRTCRVLGLERSVICYERQLPRVDQPPREKLCVLAAHHSRWGVPQLHWRLHRDGWLVNQKRVERLYRLEGLAVPRRIALGPIDAWSLDFTTD
jgi:putative transposase